MQTNLTLASTVAKHFQTQLFQFLGNLKNLSHLCSTNHFNQSIYAKKFLNNIEAAYGCKSRDFSTLVEVVGSDCLVFIYFNFFVMPTTKVNIATPVAEIQTQLFQFLGNLKNLSHLCSANNTLDQKFHAKKYSSDIEAAYGCKSRDLSILVGVVRSDCLFFIYHKLFVMRTTKVNSASVAEIPTIQAILEKTQQVNSLHEQLMQHLRSADRELFRDLWAKARAELSRMQTLHHFGRKEASHA